MRDYGKLAPTFWTRGTGKALRGHLEAQVVAAYLMTCGSSHMIGLYYLPLTMIMHETGLDEAAIGVGLAKAADVGFAFYDAETETVWVPNMATYQIGDELRGKDKRKDGVVKELRKFKGHRFLDDFMCKYGDAYGIVDAVSVFWTKQEAPSHRDISPGRGPCVDQEQEQEQEQEKDQEQEQDPAAAGASESDLARSPVTRALAAMERPEWVRVYVDAVEEISGVAPWIFPEKQFDDLFAVVVGHCLGTSRQNIPAWIAEDVRDFVDALISAGESSRFWSGYGPAGLLKWHNAGRPGLVQPEPPPVDLFAIANARRDAEEAERKANPSTPVTAEERERHVATLRDAGFTMRGFPKTGANDR